MLTPYGSSVQVFTTDQPRSRAFKKTFAPLFFAKNFYGLVVFGKKIKDKIGCFSLVDARICKNNVEMFLLAGKNLETFNFIPFYGIYDLFKDVQVIHCIQYVVQFPDSTNIRTLEFHL